VPEAVHTCERAGIGDEQIGPVSEDGEEEALSDAMVQERSDSRPRRGEAFDKGEGRVG